MSPFVYTAHMVRWPDGDLEQVLKLPGTYKVLCDVNAMSQEHALESSISGNCLPIHFDTAYKSSRVDHCHLRGKGMPNTVKWPAVCNSAGPRTLLPGWSMRVLGLCVHLAV